MSGRPPSGLKGLGLGRLPGSNTSSLPPPPLSTPTHPPTPEQAAVPSCRQLFAQLLIAHEDDVTAVHLGTRAVRQLAAHRLDAGTGGAWGEGNRDSGSRVTGHGSRVKESRV